MSAIGVPTNDRTEAENKGMGTISTYDVRMSIEYFTVYIFICNIIMRGPVNRSLVKLKETCSQLFTVILQERLKD